MFWRRVAAPMVLLAALLLALAFRWDTEATKTYDSGVVKWERDRWTGGLWVRIYGGEKGYREKPVSGGYLGGTPDYIVGERLVFTGVWTLSALVTGIWLTVAIWRSFVRLDQSKSPNSAP